MEILMSRNKPVVVTLALCLLFTAMAQADPVANTRTAKRVFLEKMGEGRFDKLDEIYGAGFVAHGASRDYTLDEDNAAGKTWRAAFPDLKVSVERTVADDGLVAVHWKASGTNTAAAGGMPGAGKKASIEGMTFFRFTAGRIVEEWSIIDFAALTKQLN